MNTITYTYNNTSTFNFSAAPPAVPVVEEPCSVAFENIHEFEGRDHYVVPNEGTIAWREVLKRTPIYKAAAICSSGEVPFFSILPLVRQKLVLVDHSCSSLYVAITKYLLLREKGAKETYRLFVNAPSSQLRQAIAEIHPMVPPKIRVHIAAQGDPYRYDADLLHREWGGLPEKLIGKAVLKLDRVKFIHGDLTDLVKDGPFGLLYLSNALDHLSRTHTKPVLTQILAALKPGGYVLAATRDPFNNPSWSGRPEAFKQAGFELVASEVGGTNRWNQGLYRSPS